MKSISMKIREAILEMMDLDSKAAHDIPEMKEWIYESTGMEFGKDYNSSHLSGVLNYLTRNNKLQAVSRGIYKRAECLYDKGEEINEKIKSDSCRADCDMAGDSIEKTKNFEIVKQDIVNSVEREYAYIMERIEGVVLPVTSCPEDFENAKRIAALAEYLKEFQLLSTD